MIILFPIHLYQKLRAYVEGVDGEISGLGKIAVDGTTIRVLDIRIFQQTVSAAETILDRRQLATFYDTIIQEEGDLSAWKLWWHSHADMQTFFSGIDEQTIADFDSELAIDNWMLSLVTNYHGDMFFRADVFSPLRVTEEHLPWKLTFASHPITHQAAQDIARCVTYHLPSNGKQEARGEMVLNPTKTEDAEYDVALDAALDELWSKSGKVIS